MSIKGIAEGQRLSSCHSGDEVSRYCTSFRTRWLLGAAFETHGLDGLRNQYCVPGIRLSGEGERGVDAGGGGNAELRICAEVAESPDDNISHAWRSASAVSMRAA